MLNLLHNLSGFILIIALVNKIVIHYYLDFLHQRNLEMMLLIAMPIYYLKPYTNQVENRYASLKSICNLCLPIALISLELNFIIGAKFKMLKLTGRVRAIKKVI